MKKRGWLVGAVAVIAVVVAVAFVMRRAEHGSKADLARKILPIADRQFQECVFGAEIPPNELGRYEVIAQITGAVDAHRVYSCAALEKTKLEEIVRGHDDPELVPLWSPIVIDDSRLLHEGFGVCGHIADVRKAARSLGLDAPAPDCESHRDALQGIADRDETGVAHIYRDRLALVDGDRDLRVHRTQDGVTWDLSPPTITTHIYVTGGTDAFAYGPATEHENAHYVVLDGDKWHTGALVVGGKIETFRRTASGWCIATVDPSTDMPLILHLDPLMDHVTRTAVPALRGRWSNAASREALIDKQGNVGVVVVTVEGDHTSLETHFVTADGKLIPPTVTKVRSSGSGAHLHMCRGPSTDYLVLENVATLATADGGRTFAQVRDGKMGSPVEIDCTDAHLFVASKADFEICDHQACTHTPMPLPKDVEAHTALNVRGEQPQLLVRYDDVAFLAFPNEKDGLLKVNHAWRIKRTDVVPVIRIDGLWFAP